MSQVLQLLSMPCLPARLLWLLLNHPQLPTTLVQLELYAQQPGFLCLHGCAQLQLSDGILHSIAKVGWLLGLLLRSVHP